MISLIENKSFVSSYGVVFEKRLQISGEHQKKIKPLARDHLECGRSCIQSLFMSDQKIGSCCFFSNHKTLKKASESGYFFQT
jgi:hypothetical protein